MPRYFDSYNSVSFKIVDKANSKSGLKFKETIKGLKNMFLKFCNIRSKTFVLEFLFNKVAEIQGCNFIKK